MLKNGVLIIFACLVGLLTMSMTQAQTDQGYNKLAKPVTVDIPAGKVLVQEIFWYSCPHCYDLQPLLTQWRAKQPNYIAIELLPATFGSQWLAQARAYYAAKQLGILSKTHQAFFAAVQKQHQPLDNDAQIAQFFSHFGVTEKQALGALTSFAVKNATNQAHQIVKGYQLLGVPAIVINGTYVITPESAGSLANMLTVADQLTAQLHAKA